MIKSFATLFDNPIFVREMRRRMRRKAIITSLLAYVGLMCAVSFFIILTTHADNPSLPQQEIGQRIGQGIFFGISVIQGFLVLLAAPSITSSMTMAEREKQTFEFLQATTLSANSFIIGNLLSSLMYVLIVLVCAMPVLSVTFLYGGISIDDVLTTFGVLLAGSLLLICFAIFSSALNTRARSVQALVTVVCVLVAMMMMSTGMIFAGFRTRGSVPLLLQQKIVLGFSFPLWVLLLIPFLTLCATTLIAAGRKLYEPDNRLFNYRQYAVIFILFNLFFLLSGNWKLWYGFSLFLLYFGAINFSTGRPFLGDETWEIKRRHRWLRRFDEGLPYMAVLLACWFCIGGILGRKVFGVYPVQAMPWVMLYGATSTFLYYAIGKLASQFAQTRAAAFAWTAAIIGIAGMLLPLFMGSDYFVEFKVLANLSPIGFLDDLDPIAAKACAISFMATSTLVTFIWIVSGRRHKESDYHYDLNWPDA